METVDHRRRRPRNYHLWYSTSTISCIATMLSLFLSRSATVCHAFPIRSCRRQLSMSMLAATTQRRLFATSKKTLDEEEKTLSLEWESFDFSDSPKWDPRFLADGKKSIGSMYEELNDEVYGEEARQDQLLAIQQKQKREAWNGLSPQTVQDSIRILQPYVKEDRLERITEVLKRRTRYTQFLFENPSNPSNVWACLRTMDSFGIQHVHIVTESKLYQGKAALLQKQGMRTAMGSAQWLTIHHYVSTEEAIQTLRKEHSCRILASDLNPSSIDIRDIDWNRVGMENGNASGNDNYDDDNGRPICIVMGNEKEGISDTMRELADASFQLPMCGFAESFNLSVATAITLAHLSAASSREEKGPLRPGDLPKEEYDVLVLRGMINSISQKKIAQALLKKEGIMLPDSLYQKGINLGKKLKYGSKENQ